LRWHVHLAPRGDFPENRLRARSGAELTVTRIDQEFMGRASMLAFVEDSEEQRFKMPALRDGDVELVGRDDAVD